MKLKISNLGVIDSMTIDMSKPFILFAGNNGTGKTYASTFLYTLILEFRLYLYMFIKDGNKILTNKDNTDNVLEGELNSDILYDFLDKFLINQKKQVLESMNLNIKTDSFKCEIVTSKEEWKQEVYDKAVSLFMITKRTKSFEYKIAASKNLLDYLQSVLMTSLYFDNVNGAYIFTAERNGIYTFSKELSVGRLRFPEQLTYRRYPRPISDGLANAEDLVNRKKEKTKFYKFADEIEKMILHGSLSISDEGEILFSINDNKNLSINQSSSAIKTLAPLVFYLRHIAWQDNILFIDEPELNLHPMNQILLARIFVKMINAGLRLIISTHSDYIIREINNMIMADILNKKGDKIVKSMGYDKSLCLSREMFSPYLFKMTDSGNVVVLELEVDKYGFSMPSIDDAINQQNEVTNAFYDVLRYDYPQV